MALNVSGLYTFKLMLNGNACSSCAGEFKVQVYSKIISGIIGKDTTICYETVPSQLTSTPATGGVSSNYLYQWIQSEDNGKNWKNIPGATFANYTPPQALTITTLYRLITSDITGTYKSDTSNTVTITTLPKQLNDYPDIRVRISHDVGDVNLSKYLDTIEITSIQWNGPIPISSPEGMISSDDFGIYKLLTFTYTVSNTCIDRHISRQVYLDILRNGRIPQLEHPVKICYKQAEAVQISQIFGIEACGTLLYDTNSDAVKQYITRSTSDTYNGAVIMDGKSIYEDSSIPYYGNTNAKRVNFTYSSALPGNKTYEMVVFIGD
jgi:hypothetical protein